MNRNAFIATTMICAAGLSACTAEPEPVPTVTVTATATATATVEVTVTASPSPSAVATPASEPMSIGDTLTLSVVTLSVTGPAVEGESSSELVLAWPVKSCNIGTEAVNFSSEAWFAVTEEGGRLPASLFTEGSAMEPAYPSSPYSDLSRVSPGECLTGFIPFRPGDGIVELRYENSLEERGSWAVG